jgi:DNA-binding response OmpR family regulator
MGVKMRKVLVVDDHEEILNIVQLKLQMHDYDVRILKDPTLIFPVLREYLPDLVLLDIMMPKVTGFEICKDIKANPEFKNIKIVFLTAKGMDTAKEKAEEVGSDGFIRKPFSPDELLKSVEKILKNSK